MTPKRFEELPLEARAQGSKLLDVLPELRDTIAKLYPSPERDREIRQAREEAERKAKESTRKAREEICQRALAGDFGKAVKAAALAVFEASGRELLPTCVQRIIGIVREAEKARKGAKR